MAPIRFGGGFFHYGYRFKPVPSAATQAHLLVYGEKESDAHELLRQIFERMTQIQAHEWIGLESGGNLFSHPFCGGKLLFRFPRLPCSLLLGYEDPSRTVTTEQSRGMTVTAITYCRNSQQPTVPCVLLSLADDAGISPDELRNQPVTRVPLPKEGVTIPSTPLIVGLHAHSVQFRHAMFMDKRIQSPLPEEYEVADTPFAVRTAIPLATGFFNQMSGEATLPCWRLSVRDEVSGRELNDLRRSDWSLTAWGDCGKRAELLVAPANRAR